MTTKTWPAPAKLNLFLHITGQREDGYHLLQTVFQILDVGDQLQFELREDAEIHRVTNIKGVEPEQDLVVRAAKLLQSTCKTSKGVNITLEKNIPMGGGLGGGSSDAATTLVALNQMWNCGLDEDQLAELGLQLGADVPVFVRGNTAWAEGVGEHLEPVVLPEKWFVVLCPEIFASTAKVFAASQLRRDCSAITIRDFLDSPELCSNVCEPWVRTQFPEVNAALEALNQYAPARMTGTGASCFAAFDSEQAARNAWNKLSSDWSGFVARGVNRSPLFD